MPKDIKDLSPEQKAHLIERLREKARKHTVQASSSTPISLASRNQPLPLSFAQERIWLIQQMDPTDTSYNITEAVHFHGNLQLENFRPYLHQIIQRHEVLRTTFDMVEGQPVQVIKPLLFLDLPLIDVQNLPEQTQEQTCTNLISQVRDHVFNLYQAPLYRFYLLKLGSQDHILIFSIHHIIFDGWSFSIFMRELVAFLGASQQGTNPTLAPLRFQYADFTIWQRQWLQDDILKKLLHYWEKQLTNIPSLLNMPTDYPRPAVISTHGAKQVVVYPQKVHQKLKELGLQENATLFMTALAAFQVLLYRYTGEHIICVGTPIANRNRTDIQELIGLFINSLPLCLRIQDTITFRNLLRQTRQLCLDAYKHQDLPFEQMVRSFQHERNANYSPFFNIFFSIKNAPPTTMKFADLTMRILEMDRSATKYDLMMEIDEDSSGLICRMNYRTDLFKAETIIRLLNHFGQLLESIITDPDQNIEHMTLYQKTERQLLLETWNETTIPAEYPYYVHKRFEYQVTRSPERPALIYQGDQLTYRQLNERANQLAHYLQRFDVGPDVPVCLCLERSFDLVIAIFGILKVGGTYVPLDPHSPLLRLLQMLKSIDAPLIITQKPLLKHLQVDEKTSILYLDDLLPVLAQESTGNYNGKTDQHLLAYILYTSGSTGIPKGVMVTQGGLANYLQWACKEYNFGSEDRTLFHSPITFDLSVTSLFLPLITGGTLEIVPEFDGFEALRTTLRQTQKLGLLKLTPSHLKLLNMDTSLQEFASRVKVLVVGGEALLEEDIQTWQTLSPTTRIINEYGPTETVVGCCSHEATRSNQKLVPIGKPLANTRLFILSPHLEPVPIGVYGELYIGGISLARGYLNQPDQTAEKFIPDPFSDIPGQRLYRTGDIARYLPDATIEYMGRIDNQVKVRGFRIEPGEIETALREHPDVIDAVVFTTTNPAGEKILAAYVATLQTLPLSSSALRQFLRNRLPEYMLPAVLIGLKTLPLTNNGKIDRRSLPPIDFTQSRQQNHQSEPSALEKLILTTWSEVLKIDMGMKTDNFFALGGHSLYAVQVVSRLSLMVGIEIPMSLLFEYPTAEELAQQIEARQQNNRSTQYSSIPKIPRDAPLPLSFAQERIWLIQQIDPTNPFYSNIDVLRLKGEINLLALQRSLNKLIERHENLRTTFRFKDGQLSPIISKPFPMTVLFIDLSELPEDAKFIEIQSIVQTYAHQAFDLNQGPLLRAILLREDEKCSRHILALNMHHIITDGWSMNILRSEIQSIYSSEINHQPFILPPLPIQYVDFAAWQRNYLQGPLLKDQLTYWKNQLADVSPMLAIPTDYPRPTVQTFSGKRQEIYLALPLLQRLKSVGQQAEATLFMTLLAAFQVLLSRYSGQQDIVVGTPIANRQAVELESLVGFFANTLILRSDLSGSPTFLQLLKRVHSVCLEAYDHQDLPFEKLIEELQPTRHLSHNSLFQVMFTLQNAPSSDRKMVENLSVEQVPIFINSAKFDLLMAASETDTGLRIFLEYNIDLFKVQTITNMLHHFRILLEDIANYPEKKLEDLRMITTNELTQISNVMFDAQNTFPLSEDFTRLFEDQVEKTPHLPALLLEDEQFSYIDLNRRVNQLAHHLQTLHVEPEILVALYLDRSLATVVSILAILKAGGAYIPLEVGTPNVRLHHILSDAQVGVIITQSELSHDLPQVSANILCLDKAREKIEAEPISNPQRQIDLDNLAYIIYTSGSTGRPKGVAIAHAQLLSYLQGILPLLALSEGNTMAMISTFAADLGHTVIFPALCTGSCLHLISYERMIDASRFGQYCQKRRIDYLKIVPSHLKALLQYTKSANILPHKCLLLGGEATSWALIDEIKALRPDCRILNHYGPTETTVGVMSYETGSILNERHSPVVPLRSPIGKNQIYVLDASQQQVPLGIPGELCIAGENLGRGYLNSSELTAASFIPCPFSDMPGVRLYKTGDKVRITLDGRIEFLGRMNSQVKIRGFRVELKEIEAILQKHPWVKEANVFLHKDASEEMRIIACVVPYPRHSSTIRGRQRYQLPNNLAILQLNKNETDYIYKEIFELQAYMRYGIALHENDCIFDVGGNIGLFTLFASSIAGKMQAYIFEPNPDTFEILKTNIQLYEIQAKLFNIGLAESERTADLTSFEGFSLFSGFHTDVEEEKKVVKSFMQNMQQEGSIEIKTLLDHADSLLEERFATKLRTVQLRTLSSIIEQEHIEAIDMLKINVEKSELDVLKGISDMHWSIIKQIVMEVDVDAYIPTIIELLEKHQFKYIIMQDPLLQGTKLHYIYTLGPGSSKHLIGDKSTAAISLQPFPEQILSQEHLNTYLKERLPTYMLPSSILILESLPLTPNGKIDNQTLYKFVTSRQSNSTSTETPPTNPLENTIASFWKEVLEIEQVGRDDNFFDLGGHSLLLVQVHEKIKQKLRSDISVIDLFKYPTIQSLAMHLSQIDRIPDQTSKSGRASQRSIAIRRQREIRQTSQSRRKEIKKEGEENTHP